MRIMLFSVAIVAIVACNSRKNVQCEQSANCDLSGGGMCLGAATGNMWCAYPDPLCPGGYRYSNQDVGDGLSGTCVAASPLDAGVDSGVAGDTGPATRTLTVMVGGSGMGVATSGPTGIACNANTCTHTFPVGTAVTLTQSATSGSFLGWSNDCTGTGTCLVTMDKDRTVTALFGTPGEALWSTQIGGTGNDVANSIVTDSNGDLIVVGHFSNTITVGTTMLTSAGGMDIFVAKLSALDGSVLWIKRFGGSGFDDAVAAALDSSNNIYIAGSFVGTPDFGGGPLSNAGSTDGFAMKLDSSGTYQWAKPLGGPSADGTTSISVSSMVAVVGTYQTSMTVNGTTLTNAGTSQGYLVEFGLDGSAGFVKGFPGSGYSNPVSVVIDSGGNIVIAGSISGSADFGSGTAQTSSMGDAFLAKYTSSGAYLLSKVLGSSSNDQASAVAVDGSGNMFLIGTFSGSVSFGGASPLNTNTANLVVAKYSAAGAYVWAQPFGGTTAQVVPGTEASANASGDVVVTGSFCGNLAFGTTMLASVGTCAAQDTDIFTVRLSGSNGSPITANRDGGSSQDVGYGITQTSDGKHFLAGAFQGFADFGGTAHTSAGGYDAIILGLAPL